MEIRLSKVQGDKDNDPAVQELQKLSGTVDLQIHEVFVPAWVTDLTPTPIARVDSRLRLAGLDDIKDFVSSELEKRDSVNRV